MDHPRGSGAGRWRGNRGGRGARGGGGRGRDSQSLDRGGDHRSNARGGFYMQNGGRGRGRSDQSQDRSGQMNISRGAGVENRGRGRHTENPRGNSTSRAQDARRPIGYNLLKSWSENEDSEELLIYLCNSLELLEDLMKSENIREDWYTMLVQVVNRALLCQHHSQKLKNLLRVVCKTHFLSFMLSNYLDQKQLRGMRWIEAENFFYSIIKIIKQVVKHLPDLAQTKCKYPLTTLRDAMDDIESVSSNLELRESIESCLSKVKKLQTDQMERQSTRKSYQPSLDSETPPEDFRELSVIPSAYDLSPDVKPFVRAIITKGKYKDQEHYLDIQFRLMREDFIKPLRNGIREYHEHGHDKKFRSSDIRLYHNVHFTGMTHVNGINHVVQFDVSNMKQVKWDHSKRLLTGNLLCLSNDNFTSTMIFATVSFRKTDMLKNGIVNIVCHTGLDIVLKTSTSDTFVMAETMAYYEAVHPILKGLQTIDSDLPLKEYIISCQSQLKPPKYLLQGVRKYDISCMMKSQRKTQVSVLNTYSWPSAEDMCLNASQREAAMLALTKEISVIQGPPGTGKTYVGLKVMRVLLENQDQMLANERGDRDPILVICYTNHALDQFLEGILDYCPDGIVRVGGKSSSDLLDPFNLVNVRKKMKSESKACKHSLWLLRSALKSKISEIEDVKKQVETLTTDVLSEDALTDCMSSEHFSSLQSGETEGGKGKKKRSKIHLWLNASNKSLLQALPGMIKQRMIKLVMKILHLKGRRNQTAFDSNASILDRINIYGFWLSQYQNNLRSEMEAQRDPTGRKYVASFYDISRRMSILNDSEICKVIHPDFLHQITQCFGSESEEFMKENSGLEAWVLGLQHEMNKQLDDVEVMNRFIEKWQEKKGVEEQDDFDDKDESDLALQHRQVLEDDNEEARNLQATLQVRSSGLFLLNRAKLLGVEEEDEEDEGRRGNEETTDSDGFTLVTRKKHFTYTQVKKFLSDDNFLPVSEEEEDSIQDVWRLGMRKRFGLYKLWIKRYKDTLIEKIESLIESYNDIREELSETRMKEDIDILKQARVIGMTTTGAAKKRAWLEAVGCRIIIVEEAAEVLEAHIVTALNENCKHLILIGDHKQLRPNPTVYEHAKNFGLDVSLFERLVINDVPHVTLREQHRMRESISVIMRHIYPTLQDHVSVKGYESIRGVSKNIFFIQHNEKEASVNDTMSKSNPYEAEYLTRLCNYFLLQGYEPSQITVLATYAGQVLALKKEMKKQNLKQGFRVTAVDNFQGEENDIILLSLVRSNEQNIAGFLKVDNRVCVALSRAKKGMFAIGNIKLLASQSDLWKKIIETSEKEGITGDGLPVSCSNHPDGKNVLKTPKDFDRCPQGGCHKKCDFRLDCGHTCHLQCHGYNLEHKNFKCEAKCDKTCTEGHPCRKKCWQKCGDCTLLVQKLISVCGHTNPFPCNVVPRESDCTSQCGATLPCGHRCTGKCGQCKKNGIHKKCNALVTYFWPCDHAVEVPCHYKPAENPCPKPCGDVLWCGHKCPGKCADCLEGAVHTACKQPCNETLICGHTCQDLCGVPCPPCRLPCPVACQHGPCSHSFKKRACGEVCIPCQEPCVNECPHRKCSQRCHEICDVPPCDKPCLKVIGECGHQCAGMCGETCVCRKCESVSVINNIRSTTADRTGTEEAQSEEENESRFLLKLATCRHIFYLKDFDEYVKGKKDSCEFIFCPECSAPVQNCWRYAAICQDRADRRLLQKKSVQTRHQVTADVQFDICKSLRLVLDRDKDMIWFEWRHMEDDVSKLKSAGEIDTVAAKLKFAYVICEILSLGKGSSSLLEQGLNEHGRIKTLLGLKKTMSRQQIDEFKLDLKRLLVSRYLDALSDMAEDNKIEIGESTKKDFSQLRTELKKPKVTESIVESGIILVNKLENVLMTEGSNSNLQALMMVKMNIVKRILKVLKVDNDRMLNQVLEPTATSSSTPKPPPRKSIPSSSTSASRMLQVLETNRAAAAAEAGSSSTTTGDSQKPVKKDFINKFLDKFGIKPSNK